ncbi:MAG: ABC transporter permease [Gammaproteobacteria bacterium]
MSETPEKLDTTLTRESKPASRSAVSKFLTGLKWRGALCVVLFFIAWHLAVRLGLPGFSELPTPLEMMRTFVNDYAFSPDYWNSWVVSFKRVVYGFVIAQLLGIPLGLLFGANHRFRDLFFPVFELLRPIPPLAWVPISILFWPTNESSIVFITFIGAFFVIVINVYDGVRNIKREHMWLALSLGAGRGAIFRRIMLPSIIPSIAVGMTLGIAITWNVVIAAEMIASDSGLGRMTWEGYVSSTPEVVLIGMISIGLAGYLSTLVVHYIETRMMPWRTKR